MADSKRNAFDDPLLYGTFLDSLEPGQVENMFKALGLDEKPLRSMIARTTNALGFMEHQARIPDWFAQAERSIGKDAGQIKFSSRYSKRTVELYPDWANEKVTLIQRYGGKHIDWPLAVGDKDISFHDGESEGTADLIQAIAEQIGFPAELARDYATRLAHEHDGMLFGSVDGYFSKSVRDAFNKVMSLFEPGPSQQQFFNRIAFWAQPMLHADLALSIRGRTKSGQSRSTQEEPVLVFDVSRIGTDRVRITLGWPDNYQKHVKQVFIRLDGAEQVSVDQVEWIDSNQLEMFAFEISEDHAASGSWNQHSGTLLLNFRLQHSA